MSEPLLQFFTYAHLKSDEMRVVSKQFADLAHHLVAFVPDNIERNEAIRKLLEAKDCAVRAVIFKDEPQDKILVRCDKCQAFGNEDGVGRKCARCTLGYYVERKQ